MTSFLQDISQGRTAIPLGQQLERREGRARSWPLGGPTTSVPASEPVVSAVVEPVAPPIDLDALRDEARRDGEKEGLLSAQHKIETLAQRYLDAIARLEAATRESRRPDPAEIVDLALATAGEMVGHEISLDRDLLVTTIENALAGIDEKRAIIVRLGKADLAYITTRRPELMGGGYFVEDPNLGIGGCVIETQQKIMDFSIERRLLAVRANLIELLAPPEPREIDGEQPPEIEEPNEEQS